MATPVIMPRQGQSVESCILVEWLAGVGDKVEQGQPLANIETDKAMFEVESPEAGTVIEQFFAEGDDIPVLTNIAAVGQDGEDVSCLRPAGGDATVSAAPPPGAEVLPETPAEAGVPDSAPIVPLSVSGSPAVSPRAKGLATRAGIDPSVLVGSGPAGRVIERDVQSAIDGRPNLSGAAREGIVQGGMAAPRQGSGPGGMVLASDLRQADAATASTGSVVEIPMTGIRKIIAERMHASLATTAQLTLNSSFDATATLSFRKKIKAAGEGMGLSGVTINDMIAFATVRTLREFPELNAHFLGEKTVQYPSVNIGVAMDTPRGLMVPVVRGADRMSIVQLSNAIKPMAADAQSGGINPELLTGGTFTVTNLGMLGVESFTPIVNVPEVAILGVGRPILKPIMTNEGISHIQSINLSLTIDHQAVDGGPGARFLKALTASLENFELLLATM